MKLVIKGTIGPIQKTPEDGIEIAPFTVLIGKQGTGKSILSQLVYLFRNIDFLSRYYTRPGSEYEEESAQEKKTDLTDNQYKQLVRKCLNSLRSKSSTFLSLLGGEETKILWPDNSSTSFSLTIKRYEAGTNPNSIQVTPNKHLKAFIKKANANPPTQSDRNGSAIFIPAERIVLSHIYRQADYLSFPDILAFFGDALIDAALLLEPDALDQENILASGQEALANAKRLKLIRDEIAQISERTLNGRPLRQGDRWRWQVNKKTTFALDMASSGQKANWSIFLLAQAVLYWKQIGQLPPDFALHVEEPEIHLHPEAQRDVMRILVMLANAGIHVLVTTHSLTSLYVINNMMIKYKKYGSEWAEEHPDEAIDPQIVAAYHCTPINADGTGGEVVSILSREAGFINEAELGHVNDALGNEFYRLMGEDDDEENGEEA
jgi:hypothetical protein